MTGLVRHTQAAQDVAPADFRSVLGHFCSGVTIVTAASGGELAGLTCQSFFSLSLDPPLVAFSPSRISRSYPLIRQAGAFCINVLSEQQQDLCAAFARTGDRWRDVDWTPGPTGSPVLPEVLAWIDCRVEAEYETGDHFLTIGRVVALEAREAGRPLLYFKGAFADLAAGDVQALSAGMNRA